MSNRDNNPNREINSGQQDRSDRNNKIIEKGAARPVPSYKPRPIQPKPNPNPKK